MESRATRVYDMQGFARLGAGAVQAADATSCALGEDRLDAAQVRELDRFLAGVERRAFRIAQCALRDTDDAHDVVQVAMLRLAQSYGSRPVAEWTPLFYRILYNGIRDLQRRHGLRRRFFGLLPGAARQEEDGGEDPLERVADSAPGPLQQLAANEAMRQLDRAMRRLPARQLEAFSLRCLEGLDVAATAAAMDCSEGSVKTHYFRALQALRAELAEVRP
ncbi:MAG: RNA polymerase sigma factor [Steroidobacteraceae bacterium]|nr:RNA polymerase sigma factor [Steroidobacteraceae bacterium]